MSSSIAKKFAMALSGFFLVSFLVLHVSINLVSVISAEAFNVASHFMGTNPIIQFLMQPVLAFGVVFHLAMGMRLEMKNRSARPIKYAMNKGGENSTWMSRPNLGRALRYFICLSSVALDARIPIGFSVCRV